jgi:excisionase family DNA binding protein
MPGEAPQTHSTPPASPAPAEPLLYDFEALAAVLSLGDRTLRRMDAAREIPGRVTVGRRVLFRADVVRAWVAGGMKPVNAKARAPK